MKLHKEGYATLLVSFIVLSIFAAASLFMSNEIPWLRVAVFAFVFFVYFRIVYFFRVPKRVFSIDDTLIKSPADGEIVAIEEVFEPEYLKQNCIQVSVFMSPTNVHINWVPISGKISYFKYHPGKHLVAWHPKSSALNERTSIGLKTSPFGEILIRQIAGAMARRIVCYAQVGQTMNQTQELGFIKFGSRVDVFLPLGTEINVKLKDLVIGGQTILARTKPTP
ncbi:MAG TPA: phosphatidylserine decarboxylase family protein [Bacteroidales bacterium]|nr:phosphatidylserine decarboxylase family protein [Bacteroidales bacterium]